MSVSDCVSESSEAIETSLTRLSARLSGARQALKQCAAVRVGRGSGFGRGLVLDADGLLDAVEPPVDADVEFGHVVDGRVRVELDGGGIAGVGDGTVRPVGVVDAVVGAGGDERAGALAGVLDVECVGEGAAVDDVWDASGGGECWWFVEVCEVLVVERVACGAVRRVDDESGAVEAASGGDRCGELLGGLAVWWAVTALGSGIITNFAPAATFAVLAELVASPAFSQTARPLSMSELASVSIS